MVKAAHSMLSLGLWSQCRGLVPWRNSVVMPCLPESGWGGVVGKSPEVVDVGMGDSPKG